MSNTTPAEAAIWQQERNRGVIVPQIAKAAGCSKSTIYRHTIEPPEYTWPSIMIDPFIYNNEDYVLPNAEYVLDDELATVTDILDNEVRNTDEIRQVIRYCLEKDYKMQNAKNSDFQRFWSKIYLLTDLTKELYLDSPEGSSGEEELGVILNKMVKSLWDVYSEN